MVRLEGWKTMCKFKAWLYSRFLPTWCREELLEENRRLQERIDQQRQKILRLEAYTRGMRTALRLGRKIMIQTGGGIIEPIISSDGERTDGES